MDAAEEMDKKQLERDLFGEGEEPLSESQYRAVKCIVLERDAAEQQLRALDKLAHVLTAQLNELIESLSKE